MKFFRKSTKEHEELKLRIAFYENEKANLIKELAKVRLSDKEKLNGIINEISELKLSTKKDKKFYDKMITFLSDESKHYKKMYSETNAELKALKERNNELKLLIPTQFPIDEIMGECANAAWSGTKSDRVFESTDGKIKLRFSGVVYEPTYEYFTAGCCVYYKEEGMDNYKPIYTIDGHNVAAYRNETVEFGTIEDVRTYLIDKNVGFKEVSENFSPEQVER